MSADPDKPAPPLDYATPSTDRPPPFARDPAAMNCPRCSQPLQRGTATVSGTVLGFLLVGFSHQHLFFKPSTGPRGKPVSLGADPGRVILPSGGQAAAARCAACGVTVILP